MEACLGVEREVKKVVDKFSSLTSSNAKALSETQSLLRSAKNDVQLEGELSPAQTLMLIKTLQSVKETCSRVASDHRELHSSVSKIGKAIDRSFVADYDSTSRDEVFASPQTQAMVNEVILQHFYRQGLLDVSDTLVREANLQDLTMAKEPFLELHTILDALARRDLSLALDWAARHRDELNARGTSSTYFAVRTPKTYLDMDTDVGSGNSSKVPRMVATRKSSLEMKLHRLNFVELLRRCGTEVDIAQGSLEAVQYARAHFVHFVDGHEQEVQHLMGAIMYAGPRLADSPYSYLLDPALWHEIADLFAKDACALMGLSIDSPLAVAVNAGCVALPALLNIKQVMHQRQVSGVWCAKDELPIEIDLGTDSRYHSIFACPILRQQTSDGNPPMRLMCGHCISRDALSKLASGHKLKCPYCPVEQNPSDARQINF